MNLIKKVNIEQQNMTVCKTLYIGTKIINLFI